LLSSTLLSFVLSILHFNIFLFSIGILTIHLVGTGWRFLYLRNLAIGQKVLLIDWLLLIGMAIFSFLFVGVGIYAIVTNNWFGVVPIFFGATSMLRCYHDYKLYTGTFANDNYWLLLHLERMTGAFIASLTAFMVNTVARKMASISYLESFSMFIWILPAIIVIPIIIKWKKMYRVIKSNRV
jgi:hypothetical protein